MEAEAGRDFAAPRWSARPLDVDLLVFGDLVYGGGGAEGRGEDGPSELTIPHPHLRDRAFVLVPLADVAPDLPVPPDGRTVGELLADLERRPPESGGGTAGVERVAPRGWEREGPDGPF